MSRHLEIVAAGVTTIGAIGFVRALLATRTHMPRMDFVLRATAIVMLGMVATGICSASMIIQEVGIALVMSCCVLLLAVGVVAVVQSIRNSGFFLTGWTVLLGGSVIAAMDAGGFLNDPTVAAYAPKIGAVVEAIVLSIGLALRVYRLRREKERAQRDGCSSVPPERTSWSIWLVACHTRSETRSILSWVEQVPWPQRCLKVTAVGARSRWWSREPNESSGSSRIFAPTAVRAMWSLVQQTSGGRFSRSWNYFPNDSRVNASTRSARSRCTRHRCPLGGARPGAHERRNQRLRCNA